MPHIAEQVAEEVLKDEKIEGDRHSSKNMQLFERKLARLPLEWRPGIQQNAEVCSASFLVRQGMSGEGLPWKTPLWV